MKRILLFGASGSIGASTLDILRAYPERFSLAGLSVHRNTEQLEAWIEEFSPKAVAISDPESRRRWVGEHPDRHGLLAPEEGGVDVLFAEPADLVVNGILGFAGLAVTLAAARRGVDVALANKESLVCGGGLLLAAARESGARLLPVDSEHSALFQLLDGKNRREIRRLYLTASGGPFLRTPAAELAAVSPEQALHHPTWSMGPKITVDSATLMNKGLEVIEASLLFDLPVDQIEVLVHPSSTVHALLEMTDSSVLCQMAMPDMRQPILHAMSYPERLESDYGRMPFKRGLRLDFEPLDEERFGAVALARRALNQGGTAPLALNAADEVGVASFLAGRLRFDRIVSLVEAVLSEGSWPAAADYEELVQADRRARAIATEWVRAHS